MPPQIKPLIVGLASPGLFWLATSVAFGQDAPAPQGPLASAPTSPSTYRALLLSSGKVVRGEIIFVKAADAYCLKGSGGPVPYPNSMVLKAGASVEELYRFQVGRLPGGDPDERIKLAKWCLTEKLIPQAREQLEVVKEMCPDDREVQRMLFNLATTEKPEMDSEVRRTSVEVPAPLDPTVLKSRKRYGGGLPQIFDLPPAQAVKRANEFAQYVQPVLQQNCVKCHNEKYQGNFQLIEMRTPREKSNTDNLRANLDATLNLVNQDDPSRSELLSAGLVPHGGRRNAIFRGPNDQGYMILVTWIKKVRPPANPADGPREAGGRPAFNGNEPAGGDGFATDRANRAGSSASYAPGSGSGAFPPVPPRTPGQGGISIPQGYYENNMVTYAESAEFVRSAQDNPQFPTPFPIVGAQAMPPATRPRAKPGVGAPATGTPAAPTASTQTAKRIGPNAVQVAPAETLRQLPGMDKPLYPTPPSKEASPDAEAGAPPPPSPAPKKKPKIDNALLEQIMRNRNGGAAQGGP